MPSVHNGSYDWMVGVGEGGIIIFIRVIYLKLPVSIYNEERIVNNGEDVWGEGILKVLVCILSWHLSRPDILCNEES